jgi:hypothetical protein
MARTSGEAQSREPAMAGVPAGDIVQASRSAGLALTRSGDVKKLWTVMTILAVMVAIYALALLLSPGMGPPFVARLRADMPIPLSAHLGASLVALALGPWQLNPRIRTGALGRHRWSGRAYVAAVVIGGAGALVLATRAQTGLLAGLGFFSLGVLWIGCTVTGLWRIRQGDRVAHRRWMIRSFALTLAAVTLRLYLPASALAGVSFEAAYPAIAWLCWVPNLLVAELVFVRGREAAAAAT